MLKTALFFLAAVVDASILTSIVSTQLILADVAGFGLTVTIGDRIGATIHDLIGLAVPLLLLVGLSFLFAFIVAKYAHQYIGGNRTAWYMAAGFTSLPAAITLIKLAMGGTLLASARTPFGMSLIACCGMAGGWMFAWLTSTFNSAGSAHA